jgi:beta-glucosidase
MVAGGTGSGNVNKQYVRNLKEGFEDNGIVVDSTLTKWYTKYRDFQKINLKSSSSQILLGDPLIADINVPDGFVKKKCGK